MNSIKDLNPKEVWTIFSEICKIPRPSKKEEKIILYLLDWAKKNNITAKQDEVGNIVMSKPATIGMENRKSVIMQSHIDMVCEKNNDIVHDFETDPIQAYIDGDWVKAKGTTLGADDGIGMAAQMAILISKDIKHGPIEALFTVDEETGLTGAFALKPDFFESSILLNLDSEDEGEMFIGCAGGIDTVATFYYYLDKTPENVLAYKINIKGLKGGHSGDEIHKGLGNANKILNRILWFSEHQFDIKINYLDGGNLRNAIAREAEAVFVIPKANKKELEKYFAKILIDIKDEYSITEPNFNMTLESATIPDTIIDQKTQHKLLNAIYACPHGVISMSQKMKGMVETSTNLASVKFKDKNSIVISTSQRSDNNSSKRDIANMVESVFNLAKADVVHSDGYPGWAPNPKSEILDITVDSYKRLFGKIPVVRSIHAGLECGLFLEKYPNLDMISFGPTLRAVHSPDEKINIETVEKFWKHLVDVIENIPKN